MLQLEDDAAVMELNAEFWKCLMVKEKPECLWHDQWLFGFFFVEEGVGWFCVFL